MKEILGFHLHHCPYCANAFRAIEELQAENPAFKEIKINWVEDQDAVELFINVRHILQKFVRLCTVYIIYILLNMFGGCLIWQVKF